MNTYRYMEDVYASRTSPCLRFWIIWVCSLNGDILVSENKYTCPRWNMSRNATKTATRFLHAQMGYLILRCQVLRGWSSGAWAWACWGHQCFAVFKTRFGIRDARFCCFNSIRISGPCTRSRNHVNGRADAILIAWLHAIVGYRFTARLKLGRCQRSKMEKEAVPNLRN